MRYVIQWEKNTITGRWNKDHRFNTETRFDAIAYALDWMDGDKDGFCLSECDAFGWPATVVAQA